MKILIYYDVCHLLFKMIPAFIYDLYFLCSVLAAITSIIFCSCLVNCITEHGN